MAKKDKYNYVSPASAGLGLSVTGAVSMIPGATPFAGPIGTMATGLFGGFNPTDEEMSIKDKFDESIENTWNQINDDYKLTDVCFSKLKQEVIGEDTSTDEFVDNYQRKRLEESYALVIQTILETHRGGLERKSKKTWDDEYIKNASKDMAHRLIRTLQNVFNEDDLLKILRAIADRSKDIRGDIDKSREANRLEHEQLMQILIEISESIKSKRDNLDVPLTLTSIPAPPNKLIGRDKAIEDIQGLLAKNKIVYIHAYGGVGKTAVATEIANKIKDSVGPYTHIAWITSTGNLKADLIKLNIPGVSVIQKPEDNYKIVSAFLQTTSTFLVIDNMDDLPSKDDANELNTISGRSRILITTRADLSIGKPYDLKDLDPESALLLFYQYYRKGKDHTIDQIKTREDYTYAQSIIKAATYNALFIELIAKMAYEDHWKLDALWDKLKRDVFSQDSRYEIKASYRDDERLLGHIQKLYELSNLSFRQREIMTFIALFPAEHSIFFDVFEWARFEIGNINNLGELQRHGWIERDDEGYFIHTIVKGTVELQNKDFHFNILRYKVLINKLTEVERYVPITLGYSKVRERIIISETVCELIKNGEYKNDEKTVLFKNLACKIAEVYEEQGDYKKALKYYREVFVIDEKALVDNCNDFTKWINSLEIVYEENETVIIVMDYHILAANLFFPFTPTEYSFLAKSFLLNGNHEKALEYCEKTLSEMKSVHELEELSTAYIYNNLADVYFVHGDYQKALKLIDETIRIKEAKFGIEHPSTATTYNKLAKVYMAQGDYQNAIELLNKSIIIKVKILGLDYNNKYSETNNDGSGKEKLSCLDKYIKGNKGNKQRLIENVYELECISIAEAYNTLAKIYEENNNYNQAMLYYRDTIEMLGIIQVDKSSIMHLIYNNISKLCEATNDYEQALEYLKRALAIPEKKDIKDSIYEVWINDFSGDLLTDFPENYYEAIKYYKKAIAALDKTLGPEHLSSSDIYLKLGNVYCELGQYDKALEYSKKALKILENILGSKHPDTATAYNDIAAIYQKKKELTTALEYYEKALSIRLEKNGKENYKTKETQRSVDLVKKAIKRKKERKRKQKARRIRQSDLNE